jgi:hypothetical protein
MWCNLAFLGKNQFDSIKKSDNLTIESVVVSKKSWFFADFSRQGIVFPCRNGNLR